MKSVVMRMGTVAAAALALAAVGIAQEKPKSTDPRATLKPGFRDAGQVARGLELVAALPKPEGFFDPSTPAGPPTPSEEQFARDYNNSTPAQPQPPAAAGRGGRGNAGGAGGGLAFANSDIAFRDTQMFLGSFHGFNTYDIENPRRPRVLASIVCPGGQGDVSVHGNLLFMSVEQTRGRIDCGVQGVEATVSPERFRGVRIFDISDLARPKQVAAVQTCRGSHTHTLVTDPKDKANVYVYGSGTGAVRAGEELEGCVSDEKDPATALFSIDVIKVPLAEPQKAAVVNRPRIFAADGKLGGLWQGGDHGPNTQSSRMTNQCHDITVFPELGLAAGACSGNGILMDISDPVNPVRLDHVADKNFAYWHSATFNNEGTKIVFTDEWGGGTRPRCRASDLPTWGADAVFDIVDKKLRFGGYYKIPAPQGETENCVAHNGSIIPVPGRDIMVQAWYQGGVSVFDFTDSTKPTEIAYFDRGPLDAKNLITGGYWSAYWYNGNIYGAEIARGIDVFRLVPSEHLSQNEIDAAVAVRMNTFNAQQQPRVVHQPTFIVARAYLDQLTRSKALPPQRLNTLKSAIDRADRNNPERASLEQLDALANQLEADATSATKPESERMRALAATIKARTARLRG
jgi:hypothetical protein